LSRRTNRNAASAIPSPAATSPSLPARPGLLNDHRRQLQRIRTRHDFLPEEPPFSQDRSTQWTASSGAQTPVRVFHWPARVFHWCDGAPEPRL
jgi:hypothetical protein